MISIVIPTLNEEKYLPNLLDSIKKQSYKDYEIIVADANSKDKTREIARKYGCKVVPGGSPAKGRNHGARHAKGEFIFFFDADVILTNNFLEQVLSIMKDRSLSIATCYIKPIEGNFVDNIIHTVLNFIYPLVELFSPSAPGFCILVKKELWEKVKGFNTKLNVSEDTDFVQRVSKYGKFGLIKSPKIRVSMRRWNREGRLRVLFKYSVYFVYSKLNLPMKGKLFDHEFGKH